MAYRYNGVECDTFEELQRLQSAARTTSAVVKETRQERCSKESCQSANKAHFGECKEDAPRCDKSWDGYQCHLPYGHSGAHL